MTKSCVGAPWYKVCTANKILAGGGFVGELANMAIQPNHICLKIATHAGYLPRGVVGVMPYSGRYGDGYIVATHNSNTTVLWQYYINERGLPYGG